jgi:adenylosuccinate synthase
VGIDAILEKKEDTIAIETKLQSFGIQTFPIPLSKRKKAAIIFESLPIEKKDIDAIKSWLDLFKDTLTEDH